MIRFTFMHGAGNAFVCLDAVREPALAERGDLDRLAAAMADRSSGVREGGTAQVGSDGLIVISAADGGEHPAVRMRMFNTDGSESPMCGNGLRCVAKYAVDHGLVTIDDGGILDVHTPLGVKRAVCHRDGAGKVSTVTVDMGAPDLDLAALPVDPSGLDGDEPPAHRLVCDGHTFEAVFVSMGNPHAVIYVDDVAVVDLERLGPLFEHHAAFPNRINTHFVQRDGPGEVTMRTWERGSGATGACGSGACAVCVAGVVLGRTDRSLLAHLPGGDLELRWDDAGGHVFMTGPAIEAYQGDWADQPARSVG